jgi:hypothetical protein
MRRQQRPDHPHDRRVDVEVLRDAARDAADDRLGLGSVEAALHEQPPSGVEGEARCVPVEVDVHLLIGVGVAGVDHVSPSCCRPDLSRLCEKVMFASVVTDSATPSAVQTSIEPAFTLIGGVHRGPGADEDHRGSGIQRQVEVVDLRIGEDEPQRAGVRLQRDRREVAAPRSMAASAAFGVMSSW